MRFSLEAVTLGEPYGCWVINQSVVLLLVSIDRLTG